MPKAFAVIDGIDMHGRPFPVYLQHSHSTRAIQVTVMNGVFLLPEAAAGQLLRGLGQWLAERPGADGAQLVDVDQPAPVDHGPRLDTTGRPIATEHARVTASGGLLWYNTSPEVEAIFPLADRIEAARQFGGRVMRRQVIVVEDWGPA
jgi:hypothetical protein